MNSVDPLPIKKILIINIFGIGDVLFTTPLIRNLKEHFPSCFIGYVCSKRAYDVLKDNPTIDKLFIFERDEYHALAQTSKWQFVKKLFSELGAIKKEKFDVVLDLSLNTHVNIFMTLLGIKTRIGFNYKNRSPFLTVKVPTTGFEGKHVVEHYLDLLKFLDCPAVHKNLEVFITPKDRQWAQEALDQKQIKPSDLLVGLVPGGGASWGKDVVYRRWPPENHAKLADKIIETFKAKVILLGDLSEKDIETKLLAAMKHKATSFIGKTTLGQYLALLSQCRLVVVNDGGPLHMAVACGVPTVSLVGPVDEKVYGPYPSQGHGVVTKKVDCRPCYHRFRRAACDHISCLKTITVEEVFEKVKERISSHS